MLGIPVVFHVLGRLDCDGVTKQLRHHVQRRVDTGRDAGGGHDVAVVDVAGTAKDAGGGTRLSEPVERDVMRCGIETVEQPCACKEQCAGADGQHRFRGSCLTTNPVEQRRVMHLATRAEAAGEDEHVATRGLVDRRARPNLEAIARADRRLGESDCFDSEWRGSGAKAGDTEHLERAGKVQDFDVLEDEDLYMTWRDRCHRGFGCGLHVSDLRSELARSEANACANAQHDEMCGALERRDAHLPSLQIDDAAGCEIDDVTILACAKLARLRTSKIDDWPDRVLNAEAESLERRG